MEDSEYFLQDIINRARDMGISKQDFFNDYYFDEFLVLSHRYAEEQKKLNEQTKEEKTEEVGWDQFF